MRPGRVTIRRSRLGRRDDPFRSAPAGRCDDPISTLPGPVAGRIGYNFGKVARLSFSGIRTGDLSTEDDGMSELWFANGFFRGLGPSDTAPTYSANVYELDAQTFWKNSIAFLKPSSVRLFQ